MSDRARAGATTLAPMHSTWQSLESTERSSEYGSWATAARMPGTLLALMAMPMPVPHTSSARSASPRRDGLRDRDADRGICRRVVRGVDPEVADLAHPRVAPQLVGEQVLECPAEAVGTRPR